MNVCGKVALITGAASGIGLKFAEYLLKYCAKGVGISDIDQCAGEQAVKCLEEEFGCGKAFFMKCDVTNDCDVDKFFKKTVDCFEQLDIVINNAGMLLDSEWEKTIYTNLGGVVIGTYLAMEKYLPEYRSEEDAVIINTASILGLQPMGSIPVYTSTKHGVVGLTRSFGCKDHYKRTKIRVMAICPGVTETPLVEEVNTKLLGPYEEIFETDFAKLPGQQLEMVGPALIKVLEEGKSGSLWVTEGGEEVYEVVIPDRQCMRKEKK